MSWYFEQHFFQFVRWCLLNFRINLSFRAQTHPAKQNMRPIKLKLNFHIRNRRLIPGLYQNQRGSAFDSFFLLFFQVEYLLQCPTHASPLVLFISGFPKLIYKIAPLVSFQYYLVLIVGKPGLVKTPTRGLCSNSV